MKDHFESHFDKEGEHEVETFIGECKPLKVPITNKEVMICSKKLNNNRAADYNLLTTEMVKYGPSQLHKEIKDIINV